MAGNVPENCGNCAYVRKSNSKLWCPFHDLSVNSNQVCDDFLDEYQSPKWASLAAGMDGKTPKVPQFFAKDIFAYVLSALMVLFCISAPIIMWIDSM